jgi:hypothetical protein
MTTHGPTDPTPIRLGLLNEGYQPTPICAPGCNHVDRHGKPCKSGGKAVHISAWAKGDFTASDIRSWHRSRPQDSNTGVLCGELVGVDMDILDQALAAQVDALAEHHLGPTPLRRIGRPPKLLRCYRAETPISKLETPERRLNEETIQVEIMGKGQQVAVYGTHPVTMQPYIWTDREPLNTPLIELPVVSEDQLRAFLTAADGLFAAAGAALATPPKATPSAAHVNGYVAAGSTAGGEFFRNVNKAALDNIRPWLTAIFPSATQEAGTGALRVSSADLGRSLEEDLSMHPTEGGHDFGTRESLSPIDVAIKWGRGEDAKAAAFWLCEQLGKNPADLGWKEPTTKTAAHGGRKAQKNTAGNSDTTFYDPWADPPPPQWPGGVLSSRTEETLAAMSLRDGVDFSAQAVAHIAAASGAAPKDARFAPYQRSGWSVPPIIWVLLLAESGQRKTALQSTAFDALQRVHGERWTEFMADMKRWHELCDEKKRKTRKPAEPHSFIISDVTLEKLQQILAANPRGTMMLKDELAGMLDFGRYGGGNGAAVRAFYLEAYEGGSCTVHRLGRDSLYIPNNALTIFGGIQPERLAAFKGLESDGLIQRFAVLRPPPAEISRPDIMVPGKDRLNLAIGALARLSGKRYYATPSGGELIRQTERDAAEYATISDYGTGFQGFCRKLHGTHVRLSLILHLLDSPEPEVIPDETIERAGRLTRFLLAHARDFYVTLPDAGLALTRDVGGWLLTKAPNRVRATDVASGVAGCRGMGSKRLTEALDPLVIGGWLEPEEPFPSNRAWLR